MGLAITPNRISTREETYRFLVGLERHRPSQSRNTACARNLLFHRWDPKPFSQKRHREKYPKVIFLIFICARKTENMQYVFFRVFQVIDPTLATYRSCDPFQKPNSHSSTLQQDICVPLEFLGNQKSLPQPV